MAITSTAFTGANGIVELRRDERRDLADYIESFSSGRQPKLENYIANNLITMLFADDDKEAIQKQMDKIIGFDMRLTETKFVYLLDVTYATSSTDHINELLKVVCNRKGVKISSRGKTVRKGKQYSILIDVAKGGNITDGVARLAKLVYYLNKI